MADTKRTKADSPRGKGDTIDRDPPHVNSASDGRPAPAEASNSAVSTVPIAADGSSVRDEAASVVDLSDPTTPACLSAGRYRQRVQDGSSFLLCTSSASISILLAEGRTVTGRGRFQYPAGTIFLDGAFHGPPFVDNRRRQYSLDHHTGCVRAFTLASCEQAAALVFQGIPLDLDAWIIVLNDLDPDSVLAAWILLNHAELRSDGLRLLAGIMPLVRLEGCIDVYGLEGTLLSALSADQIQTGIARLETLKSVLQRREGVESLGLLSAALEMLDSLVFTPDLLTRMACFEELGRAGLGPGKTAILCRSARGIYDAEIYYKERLGASLGLLILEMGGGRFTVRLVDSFMKSDLTDVYRILNANDPAVIRNRETGNAWGGSREIGGSPRHTGSSLAPERVLELVAQAFSRGTVGRFLGRIFGS